MLFQPVKFGGFESRWRQMAERAALENMHWPQDDLRCAVGSDALIGENAFANPYLQARWHPAILEQCQKIGMRALLKNIEMASPKPQYVKTVQGTKG